MDLRQADAAGGRAVRPLHHHVSRTARGRHAAHPERRSCFPPGRRRGSAGTTSLPAWAWPTTCSGTARRPSSSTWASTWKPMCRATATTWTSVRSLALPSPRRGRGPTPTRITCRSAISRTPRRTANAGEWRIGTSGRTRSAGPSIPHWSTGWGNRPYNWEMGVSVQQELAPRVSVNVGYFRRWFGNWYMTDNRATTLSDYTPFSIHGADRCAAARRRGPDDRRPVQPRPGQGRAGRRALAALEQLRAADRELARGGSRRRRAAAERAHGAGGHEHGAQARGQLRDSGDVAGDGQQRHHGRTAIPPRRSPSARPPRRTRIAASSSRSSRR